MKLIRFLRDWLRTFRDPDAPDAELKEEQEEPYVEEHGVEFTFRLDYLLIAVLLGIIVWQLSGFLLWSK